MTDKEILELQKRIYAISYSGFPLDSFFNDIEKNDNPRFNKDLAYKDLKLIVDEIYKLKVKAKKYDEKEKSPTLEEVKKEWEEKGFEVENNSKEISFRSQKLNTDIYIDKVSKDVQICVCHYNYAQTISFELHKLIHKTFKALGWL